MREAAPAQPHRATTARITLPLALPCDSVPYPGSCAAPLFSGTGTTTPQVPLFAVRRFRLPILDSRCRRCGLVPFARTRPAHVFLCMLAYYVQWHMRRRLAPLLFEDHDRLAARAQRNSPVEPAPISPSPMPTPVARPTATPSTPPIPAQRSRNPHSQRGHSSRPNRRRFSPTRSTHPPPANRLGRVGASLERLEVRGASKSDP